MRAAMAQGAALPLPAAAHGAPVAGEFNQHEMLPRMVPGYVPYPMTMPPMGYMDPRGVFFSPMSTVHPPFFTAPMPPGAAFAPPPTAAPAAAAPTLAPPAPPHRSPPLGAPPAGPAAPHQQQHLNVLPPGPPIVISPRRGAPDGCNLFVFHIPNDMMNQQLYELCAPCGRVRSVRIMVDRETQRSRGFGFVSFEDQVGAERAIEALNGYQIGHKRLKVEFKSPSMAGDGRVPQRRGSGSSTSGGGGRKAAAAGGVPS